MDEVRAIAAAATTPLLYNMTYGGKSPLPSAAELSALGYRLIIYPADLQLSAIRAMRDALAALRDGGTTPASLRASFEERDAVVRLADYLALSTRYRDA